jgi:serine/threonine-protein kinase
MKIGKVTVLEELGTGAGSRVFRVRREKDSCEYALKVAHVGTGRTRKYLAQARNEYRIGRMLDHPNLIRFHGLETDAGWFSEATTVKLLTEYAPGRPMDLLPLQPVDELLWVFKRITAAVAHMHARGVIHADLKPNNLILESGPHINVKVIDYGVSKLTKEQTEHIRTTPEFMAPETTTHRLLNEKTDIYSFGATMYRLTTLQFPPSTLEAPVLGARGFERQYQSVRILNPKIPGELSDLIRQCLSFDPNRRPASMEDLGTCLEDIRKRR